MLLLLTLVAVPIVVGVAGFFLGRRRITPGEALVQIVLVTALISIGYYTTRWLGVQDHEIWNGRVAKKESGSDSCCHSYDCNCRQECTGSGDEERCQQVCDTCYEHDHDYYWAAYSTNGEQIYYSGCAVDPFPPYGYEQIRIGEPTAVEHQFTNYVKADPRALVEGVADPERFADAIPPYPRVRGWNADRFLFVGVVEPAVNELDAALDQLNADLGAAKQVNMIVVVTAEADPGYFGALRAAWLGGKKNDVVLVVGAPAYPTIAWARVMAWHQSRHVEDEFKGALARRVEMLGTFDGDQVLDVLRDEVTSRYQRRPFSDFEYLMARARPSRTAIIWLFAIGLILSSLMQLWFWRNKRWMRGPAPHRRVQAAARRARDWWHARRQRRAERAERPDGRDRADRPDGPDDPDDPDGPDVDAP